MKKEILARVLVVLVAVGYTVGIVNAVNAVSGVRGVDTTSPTTDRHIEEVLWYEDTDGIEAWSLIYHKDY